MVFDIIEINLVVYFFCIHKIVTHHPQNSPEFPKIKSFRSPPPTPTKDLQYKYL